jgi:hypothetical protein
MKGYEMTIYEFLIELNKDAQLQHLWLESPQKAMDEKGVSPGDQEIILSGNLKRIMEAVGLAAGDDVAWIIWMGPTVWAGQGQD